jgi:hypothetical protein
VSLIGLSAVAVGRINLRTAAAGGDGANAELLALSAIEHATSVINSDTTWRTRSSNDQETPPFELGNGSFTWKLVDEADANLAAGGLQSVRVYGTGRAGDARRGFSVVLAPTGANVLTNPGIEGGATPYAAENDNCVPEASGTDPRNGLRSLWIKTRADRTAGPRQNVTGKISSGKSYYAEAWVKMSTAVETPRISLILEDDGLLLGLGSGKEVFRVDAQPVGLQWTKVHVTLNPSWSGTADRAFWRIETSNSAQDFWIDDLKLVESATPAVMGPASDSWRQESVP